MWEPSFDTNYSSKIKATITPKGGELGVALIMSNNVNKHTKRK